MQRGWAATMWDYGSPDVREMERTSTRHGPVGSEWKSQGPGVQYATPRDALLAMRVDVERKLGWKLAQIDAELEKYPEKPTAPKAAQRTDVCACGHSRDQHAHAPSGACVGVCSCRRFNPR